MAIKINHYANRVDPPTVTIYGRRLHATDGTYARTAQNYTYSTSDITGCGTNTSEGTNIVRNRVDQINGVQCFDEEVTVTITPDASWTTQDYSTIDDAEYSTVPNENAIGRLEDDRGAFPPSSKAFPIPVEKLTINSINIDIKLSNLFISISPIFIGGIVFN